MAAPERLAVFEAVERTRQDRRAFLETVEAGGVDLDLVFDRADTDPVIGSMKLLPLLEALPDMGKVSSRRALEAAGIAESARAGTIDGDRRARLAEARAAGLGP